MNIHIKRVYEEPQIADGYRILVDRIWPRGVSKEKARVEEWLKDLGPSNELRKWFGHKPERFKEFSERYKKELEQQREVLDRIKEISDSKRVCLVYGAKDTAHNQAVVIKNVLESL